MSIEKNEIKFLHSSCFFNNCYRNDQGGAIRFNCKSSIVQHRFCTTNTCITGITHGFHSYVHLHDNNIDRQNYIIECSISHCQQQRASSITYSHFGNCGIFSSNYSNNSARFYSGFYIVQAKGISVINFSTFEGNNAKSNICLSHGYSSDGSFQDIKCNIVNNVQESPDFGTVYAADEVSMFNCIVTSTSSKGKLFARSSVGYLYLINCSVDNVDIYTLDRPGTFFTHLVFSSKDLNILAHLSSYNCNAEIRLDANIKSCNENSCDCNIRITLISIMTTINTFVLCYKR